MFKTIHVYLYVQVCSIITEKISLQTLVICPAGTLHVAGGLVYVFVMTEHASSEVIHESINPDWPDRQTC